MTVVITGESLTLDEVVRVARGRERGEVEQFNRAASGPRRASARGSRGS